MNSRIALIKIKISKINLKIIKRFQMRERNKKKVSEDIIATKSEFLSFRIA